MRLRDPQVGFGPANFLFAHDTGLSDKPFRRTRVHSQRNYGSDQLKRLPLSDGRPYPDKYLFEMEPAEKGCTTDGNLPSLIGIIEGKRSAERLSFRDLGGETLERL